MNINALEALLIGMVASTLILAVFIYLGISILNFLKISNLPKLKLNEPKVNAAAFESENLRKKVETKANIICSLPIHQESRPEAPLS